MHILVMRPGAIGDTLLTFPVLQALREQHANAHITLVGNANVLPLARASGVADEVFDYQDILWSELFSTAGIQSPMLRDLLHRTDLAICWLHDREHIVEDNLRKAGIKRVIVAPGRPVEGQRMHSVEYLAGTVGLRPTPPPQGTPTQGTRQGYPYHDTLIVAGTLCAGTLRGDAIGGIPSLHRIAIHPGSGSAQKCWPAHCFTAVIERLWQQACPILLLAGPADTERLDIILAQLPSPLASNMLEVLANRPLLEVAQRLQACACYLGNDSGITHLAAMLGVPTVAIFGPTDPAVWRPLGPAVKVIHECVLERLPVDAVADVVVRWRAGYPPGAPLP